MAASSAMDIDGICKAVAVATQAATRLPTPSEFGFHATTPAFRTRAASQTQRLRSLIDRLLTHVDSMPPPDDPDDDDECMDRVVEVTDGLMERVDVALDAARAEASGHTPGVAMQTTMASNVSVGPVAHGRPVHVLHANNIHRPQLSFKDKVDNSMSSVFVPKIRRKPNAKEPLDLEPIRTASAVAMASMPPALASHIAGMSTPTAPGQALPEVSYPHPYQPELDAYEPPDGQLTRVQPQRPTAVNSSDHADDNATWVDTVEGLRDLQRTLDAEMEIAIDLEAHNYRTYASFACLMQLSTRTRDYLVDVIALRSEMHILNSCFTNPTIVKVMHGADSDILWLQKDLGLYMVNMFDTGQAARLLEFPRLSLAYLLKKFCGVTANKAYQLADWRIRPLTSDMARYAREDTHYLLYIYDELRNLLIDGGNENANLLQAAWMRSRDICLLKYEKPITSPDAYLNLYERHSRSLNAQQLEIFRRLFYWRDHLAREEDESIRYVMPDHMLFDLANASPREASQVIACCNPTPPLVRMNAHVIVEMIAEAIEATQSTGEPSARSGGNKRLPGTDTTHSAAATEAASAAPVAMTTDGDGQPGKAVWGQLEAIPIPFDASAWVRPASSASALARSLEEKQTSGHGHGAGHESLAKAADVYKSFATLQLYGDFVQGLEHLTQAPHVDDDAAMGGAETTGAGGSGAAAVSSETSADAGRQRHDPLGDGNGIIQLSAMPRTGGAAKRPRIGTKGGRGKGQSKSEQKNFLFQ
eukprot:m.29934 g.29934  ORF g.29934 m.29934 type:complete len:759 (+) comp4644_c0_seq2:65-2341(+)